MSKNLSKNQIHDLTMLVLNQLNFQEASQDRPLSGRLVPPL
jgi:hypothetical protein